MVEMLSSLASLFSKGAPAPDPTIAMPWELYRDVPSKMASAAVNGYNPYREFNSWVNDVFFSYTGLTSVSKMGYDKFGDVRGYYLSCYLRDFVLGSLVYWGTAALWHVIIYRVMGNKLFADKKREFPSFETISDQMRLAQSSLVLYAALPVLSEYLIESKLTKTYFYVEEVGGWGWYAFYLAMYIVLVEIGIYWMHRTLHTNKFLYKYVHALHHKYNKASTLTPWASLAFNPLDGCLQACPYVICLFLVPVHYFTHVFLLFFSGVWATNIHDALWGDTEPILGSKYHTLHHTHYHYNYGQFFIFCDYFWGTLRLPEKSKFD